MLFEVEERKPERPPFVERIRPLVLSACPKVKTYFGAPQKALGELLALVGIGACVSPTTKKHFDSYAFYFLDNGAFRCWKKGVPFDEKVFFDLIDLSLKAKKQADFLVLPDKVGEGRKSLEFSSYYAEKLKGISVPFALALQDGMEEKEVADFVRTYGVKVLFIGGTTEWKWRTAPAWKELSERLGVKVHLARVPSAKRVIQARKIGVHSIDTTAVLWEERKVRTYLKALSLQIREHSCLF